MKKSIAILSVLATSAALAATEVTSSNTFGFVPVTASATELTCVAVPVKGYTAGSSIKIAEILQVTDLAVGDTLYTMNGGAYNEYTLSSEKTWTPSKVVTVDGSGNFTEVGGTLATEATIQPGGAFWLKTKTEKISIMGDATTAASAATITTGWQLIGNPSMTKEMEIQSIDTNAGATPGSILKTAAKTYTYASGIGWVTGGGKPTIEKKTTDKLAIGEGALFYQK